MHAPMVLEFPGRKTGRLTGWSYFWGWYVTGFDPSHHCQKCLLGWRAERVKNAMPTGDRWPVTLDERDGFDFFYLCGGDEGWNYNRNFHLAVRRKDGWDTKAVTATGQQVIIRNSEYIEINGLPDGFDGKDRKFTTCRNYQFGVGAYMLDSAGSVKIPNSDGTYGFRPEPDGFSRRRR